MAQGIDPFSGARGGELWNMVDNYVKDANWGTGNPMQMAIYNAAMFYATGEIGGALLSKAWNLGRPYYLSRAIKGGNSVYVSVSKGVTQYVGITNNFARRAAEHLTSKGISIHTAFNDRFVKSRCKSSGAGINRNSWIR